MSLTDRIVDVLVFQEKKEEEVPEAKEQDLQNLSQIGEDIYLEFAKKSDIEQQCFACGAQDRIILGGNIYAITGLATEGEGDFPSIFMCPRHMTDLAEQILLHVLRVGRGKEAGAIKLPLLKWKGEDE